MKRRAALTGVFFILGLCLVSAAFFAGYLAAQSFFAVPGEVDAFLRDYRGGEEETDWTEENKAGKVPQEPARRWTFLYFVDAEKPFAVVGVLDAARGKLGLYTAPSDTRLEFSEEQYRRLSVRYPAMPQLCRLSVLTDYMGGGEAAELLAGKWGEDFLCSFGSASALTEEQAGRWFASGGEYWVFSSEAVDFFESGAVSRKALGRLTGRFGEGAEPEGTLPAYYAETLALLQLQDCSAALLAGSRENGGYRLDRDRARMQLSGK